jgi:hypothetical protein
LRGSDGLHASAGGVSFTGQRQLGQVTGHDDLVGRLIFDGADERLENSRIVMASAAQPPADVAEQALAGER